MSKLAVPLKLAKTYQQVKNTMKPTAIQALLVFAISFSICTLSMAQYVWLNENGQKQFSDHAPPPSVPKSQILKYAGKKMEDHDASSITNSGPTEKQPENLADKELAYKKRRDELAEKEKKNEAEAKNAATKSENCRRLNVYKQSLETGQRMLQMDANGTTSFMTDEKRTQELNQVQQNMSECS